MKKTYFKNILCKIISSALVILLLVFMFHERIHIGLTTMIFLVYFGISVIWKLPNHLSVFLALLFFVCIPFLVIFKKFALAETFSIYTYYFLVITVMREIIEPNDKNHPNHNKRNRG